MKGKRKWVIFLMTVGLITNISMSEASVIFNEIFADPPMGLSGDANNDGIRSGTQDEFIEILNYNANAVDISGWSVADGVSTRHIFPSNTVLAPYTFLAVFGGGNPVLPNINWQVASSGSLGLNNSGDSVSLFNTDNLLIDNVVYGSIGGNDQSITLFPDGIGSEFVHHSTLDQAQGALFSPGTSVDSKLFLVLAEEEEPMNNPVVPELPTLVYFGIGWGSIISRKLLTMTALS